MQKILTVLGFLLSLAVPQALFAADKAPDLGPPDATVEFDTTQYSNIFGKGRTGLGTVKFQGFDYAFTARVVGSPVVSDQAGVATVYRMKRLGDFLGDYKPIGSGNFQNSKGVIISPRSKTGQAPSADVKSFSITFVDTKRMGE